MTGYLFIESRDPFADTGVARSWDLAKSLADRDQPVSVYLVQNAVFGARMGAKIRGLEADQGVELLVDDVSLRERAIAPGDLRAGVAESDMERVVEMALEDGRKVIWN